MPTLTHCGRDAELVGVGVEHRHAEAGAVAPVFMSSRVEVVPEIARLEETIVLLFGSTLVVSIVGLGLGVAADFNVKACHSSVLLGAQNAFLA